MAMMLATTPNELIWRKKKMQSGLGRGVKILRKKMFSPVKSIVKDIMWMFRISYGD